MILFIFFFSQMAQIDWNDFVVVETIDLLDNEKLPAPNNFSKNDKADKQANLGKNFFDILILRNLIKILDSKEASIFNIFF